MNLNSFEQIMQVSMFSELSEGEVDFLREHSNIVNYGPSEMMVKQGSQITHLLILKNGLAKEYLEGLNKNNLILQMLKAGDILLGPGVYTDFKHHSSICALTHCTVCFIEIHPLLDTMKGNQGFLKQILKLENQKKISTQGKLISLTQKQMAGRIADALLYLRKNIYNEAPYQIEISRKDLADMTALAKESVVRTLKQFKDEKIISLDGRKISVNNMDAIQYFSIVG